MTIITIGVGTAAGALIPDPEAPGGFYRDREGKPVVSRLERDVLLSIANTTGGLYLPLDGDGVNDRRIDLILENLERTAMKGKLTRKALDRYRWPLGAGLLLLFGAWIAGIVERHTGSRGAGAPAGPRRTSPPPLPAAVALLTIALCFQPGTSRAAADPPKRELPQGNPWAFYTAGDYEAALHNFQQRTASSETAAPVVGGGDPVVEFGRGAAAFKQKDYDLAADAFGSAVLTDDLALRAQAHYNLGNSIYQKAATLAKEAKPKTLAKLSFLDGLIRQLENGLENYQQALILKPGDEDFQANHDTTDALIQKLRDIREAMAQQQGKAKKKAKKGKAEGESPGKGKGEGEDEEGGTGSDGEEEGEGKGKKQGEGEGGEGEKEKAAREKSNQEKEGKIGEQNPGGEDGKDGKEPGDEPGEEGDSETDSEDEINPETGFSAAEAKRQLERLSDEDFRVRPRIEEGRETRPARDW